MRPLKVGVQLPEVERVVPWPELRRPRLDATESVAYSARKEVRDARADPYSGERPR